MGINDLRNVGLLVCAIGAMVASPLIQAADGYVLGVCKTAAQSEGAEIVPIADGDTYLYEYHRNDPSYKNTLSNGVFFAGAKVTLINAPEHGDVVLTGTSLGTTNSWYHYMPVQGFSGRDRFAMLVEKDGVKVRIHYVMEVLDDLETPTGRCLHGHWKISATSPELDNANLHALLNSTDLGNTVTIGIANLTNLAVGQAG